MADLNSANRMVDNRGTLGQIMWEPWIDPPVDVMQRFPSLRAWSVRMRLRDESNQSKVNAELARLQQTFL